MLGHEKRTKGLLLVPRADLSPKGDFYKENKTAALLKNYCEKNLSFEFLCSHIQMTENVPQARKEWNKGGQKSLLHLFLKQDWNFMRYSRSRKKCWKCEVMQKYWDSTATNATQSRKITRKKKLLPPNFRLLFLLSQFIFLATVRRKMNWKRCIFPASQIVAHFIIHYVESTQ